MKKQKPFLLIYDCRCQFHQHFYVRIFRTNVIFAAFSRYVLALNKLSCKKCARLTLMKLTADREHSSSRGGKRERCTLQHSSFSLIHNLFLWKFPSPRIIQTISSIFYPSYYMLQPETLVYSTINNTCGFMSEFLSKSLLMDVAKLVNISCVMTHKGHLEMTSYQFKLITSKLRCHLRF